MFIFEQNQIKKMISSKEETKSQNEPLLKQSNEEVKSVRNKSFSFIGGSSSSSEQERPLLDMFTHAQMISKI